DSSPPPAAKLSKSKSSESLDKGKAKAAQGESIPNGGGKAVDNAVPQSSSYKVYDDLAVKLNQTNIGHNNNKFYIIQVLTRSGKFFAWNRWGRVGEPGDTKLKAFPKAESAIQDFRSKFREKTGNSWENAENFKPASGRYIIVETEDSSGGGDQ
ncbi:unnamed protein product, partial [Polarella glacialis]